MPRNGGREPKSANSWPMRILEMNDIAGEAGGAERHFMSLRRLLREKGHHVSTFHALALQQP